MPKFMNLARVATGIARWAESAVSSSDWAAIITSITGQISVSTVVSALGVAVAAAIGLVFMWWGARKAVSILMRAFRSGKLRF